MIRVFVQHPSQEIEVFIFEEVPVRRPVRGVYPLRCRLGDESIEVNVVIRSADGLNL